MSCLPAVTCGTAAERGTTDPKRAVVPLQGAVAERGCPSQAARCLSRAAAGLCSQLASILLLLFSKLCLCWREYQV